MYWNVFHSVEKCKSCSLNVSNSLIWALLLECSLFCGQLSLCACMEYIRHMLSLLSNINSKSNKRVLVGKHIGPGPDTVVRPLPSTEKYRTTDKIMHAGLFCFVLLWLYNRYGRFRRFIHPYSSGMLHSQCGNRVTSGIAYPVSNRWKHNKSANYIQNSWDMNWGLVCQKQVSRAGTSNYNSRCMCDVNTCPCPGHLLLNCTRHTAMCIHVAKLSVIDFCTFHSGSDDFK